VAVAGWRFLDQLVSGRVLYIDDLVTDEALRSSGFGARLLEWLVTHARDTGCARLELDSGVWRSAAHQFYFRNGLSISSHHFRTELLGGDAPEVERQPRVEASTELRDPLTRFRAWAAEAARAMPGHPHLGATCVATVDDQGRPDARMIDLKDVTATAFVFTTDERSAKVRQLEAAPHAALTTWWAHLARQVRIAGAAHRLPDTEADAHFARRPRDAQLASWASPHGKRLDDAADLQDRLGATHARFAGGNVPRPPHWTAWALTPDRVEFLRFRADRMHERLLYERSGSGWVTSWLAP
jgi:pyridoxamine 5'-phosphate oxidase